MTKELEYYLNKVKVRLTEIDKDADALIDLAIKGDEEAVRMLLESKLLTVYELTCEYEVPESVLFDCICEGNEGLLEAVKSLDESHREDFDKYVEEKIRHNVEAYIRELKNSIHPRLDELDKLLKKAKTGMEIDELSDKEALILRIRDLKDRLEYLNELSDEEYEYWSCGMRENFFSDEDLQLTDPKDLYVPSHINRAIALAEEALASKEEE